MVFDQAQSARLGQRVALEAPGIRQVSEISDIEAPYSGQLAFVPGESALYIYSNGSWVGVAGSGIGGASVVLSFPVPNTTWIGMHGFSQSPVDVTIVNTSGEEIMGDIAFTNANTVQVSFVNAQTGYLLIQK